MLLKYKAKLRFLKRWSGGVYMQVLKKRSLRWVWIFSRTTQWHPKLYS